jgi:cation diffusion facilitator CzcD-associated flavoprotein CzcO
MPSTYTLISSNILTSTATSITFSAIPATFTDLVFRYASRHNNAFTISQSQITFNGSSASNYNETALYGDASSVTSGRQSSASGLDFMYDDADSATANTFSNTELYIPNYKVSASKPMSWFGVTENNATGTNSARITANASLWQNTSAITSITILALASRNFMVGSSFYLYGISNS